MASEERPKVNIIEALDEFFAPIFPDRSTWKAWEVVLKCIYALPMSVEEWSTFRECTGRSFPAESGYKELLVIAGRRSGKSKIAAVICSFEAVFGNWQSKLSAGEKAWIFCIGVDRQQAGIVFGYIRAIIMLFPDLLERETSDSLWLKNGVVVSVQTAGWRGSRGYSTAVIVLDELCYFRDETSANPAEEIITALLPSIISDGMLIGLSSPYARSGFMFEQYQKYYAHDEAETLIWKAPTMLMNPSYDLKKIEALIAKDKVRYTSEYFAEWRQDIESYLSLEDVQAVMTRPGPAPYDPRFKYVCFADPSGGKNDSFTMGIGHMEHGIVILDRLEEQKPPFNPSSVVSNIVEIMKGYNIKEVMADRYGGAWPEMAFKNSGINFKTSPWDKNFLYLEFLPMVLTKRVALFPNDRLLTQIVGLERRTHTGGGDTVDHAKGSHDDVANALAGLCVLLSRKKIFTPAELEARLPVTSGGRPAMPGMRETMEKDEADFKKMIGSKTTIIRNRG